MKKLYENIENIHIIGDIAQLSEVVKVMDISLQNIADSSDRLAEYLVKYSESNKGQQYQNVLNTTMLLRDELFDASLQLNDMQNQIVAYQNKIYRYEDMAQSAERPNPYLVTKRRFSADTSAVQFTRSEMLDVAVSLKSYSEMVIQHLKTIDNKRNEIAAAWRDSQYNDFSEFVDEVIRDVVKSVEIFEEYIQYLEEKIKELD